MAVSAHSALAVAGSSSEERAPTQPWHTLTVGEALAANRAGGGGLGSAEAAKRLRERGANRDAPETREPLWRELAEALAEPLQLLLIAVGTLSAIFGELRDAIAIFAIIGCVAAIETATELRARRSLAGLRALAAPRARVFRDGALAEVAVEGIVPGDVVSLSAGDIVPADCRLLDAHQLALDESALTGEPQPAAKGVEPISPEAPLAERSSMAFAGTVVVTGEGRALVVATGAATEVGQLGRMTADEKAPPTPLQGAMGELARYVLIVAVAASVLVPAIGLLRGQPLLDMLLAGLALAFATIPEELPILVSVLLAVGGYRLARQGALIRNLRAAETLGAVTEVVTDKTGTLTENRLQLVRIEGPRRELLEVALASQAAPANAQTRIGDPLELELATLAAGEGIAWEGEEVVLFPFDPERKRMSRVWRNGDGLQVAAKGAPEAILAVTAAGAEELERGEALAGQLAGEGLRVLAFATRTADTEPVSAAEAERNLQLVGFAAFDDPLRSGVREAVDALTDAGVRTIVVTGDHPQTAAAVAARAGLDGGQVRLGGAPLAKLSDAELSRALAHGTVVARATPADKLRIVRVLQRRGEIVAVTGDGVNDAPALAAADVGIAMGKRGTDLARESADLILTDDAFPTIETAVEGGRTLGSQLRRAVAFYLGAKVALVLVMLTPILLGKPVPFKPVHIVLLELFMDLGASVAFVSEPAAPDAMRSPPRPPHGRFLDRSLLGVLLTVAAALTLATFPAYLLVLGDSPEDAARSAALLAWLVAHAFVAWSIRAQPWLNPLRHPVFPIWAAAACTAGAILTLTPAATLLGLDTLNAASLATVLATAAAGVAIGIILTHTLAPARRL